MPVYQYLDLSTAHVTGAEMAGVNERFADVDDDTPRVIAHDYGAWVNVPAGWRSSSDTEDDFCSRYPNVANCLDLARKLDCLWINFDQDASTHDGLRVYEW
jgi:hypothetical protein